MKQISFRVVAPAALLLMGLGCQNGFTGSQASPMPDSPNRAARCGDPYPDQASSPYILPWQVGLSFNVGQGNCTDGSHASDSEDRFAYDIDMPIGAVILAARAGRAVAVEERFRDGNRTPGQENFIKILHSDGSVGSYYHLTHNGVLVEVGAQVRQGEAIARSGDTGDSTEPHLHFQVDACEECSSIPVTFRNTRAHPNGLVEGETYWAELF
jgi:murein DD-endopeptidase MepM/ murein hydrolase activator NlpD